MPDNEVPAAPAPPAPPAPPVPPAPGAAVSVFGGAGIGLMVGALLGLSVSPTVGAFVGAVGAALAALLGLNDVHFSSAKALRIGSFGIAVIVGATAGIYARANDLLSPGIEAKLQRKQEYLRLGYSEREALDFLHRQTVVSPSPAGGPPAGASGAAPKPTAVAAGPVDHRMTVLFSSPLDTGTCDKLTRGAYDLTLSPDDVVANFKLDGDKSWGELAGSAERQLAGADRKALLFIARDATCKAGTTPRLSEAACKALPPDAPAAAIEAALADTAALRAVADRVAREITQPGRENALRLLRGVFCARADSTNK